MQFAIDTESGLVFVEQRGRFLNRRFVVNEYESVRAIRARQMREDLERFALVCGLRRA